MMTKDERKLMDKAKAALKRCEQSGIAMGVVYAKSVDREARLRKAIERADCQYPDMVYIGKDYTVADLRAALGEGAEHYVAWPFIPSGETDD
jgi:hypothetical protein